MHEDLKHTEVDLVGAWVLDGGRVRGNAVCDRIEWLTRERLQVIEHDATGWSTLFCDPGDGRLWELTYPQSEMHGGGPPRLTEIDRSAAEAKYRMATG